MGIVGRPHDSAEWLSDVQFFDGFSADELRRVIELAHEESVTAGALLIDQGDPGVDCYVIVSGTAAVYVGNDHIATLESGSMVGEMALIDHRPRTASVVAESDLELLRFHARDFRQLLDEMPKASERVMTLLQQRSQRGA